MCIYSHTQNCRTEICFLNLEVTRSWGFVGYFRFKKFCSSTHNAECECIEGFHCLGPQCTRCEKDCRPGQELTKQGRLLSLHPAGTNLST